MLPHVQLLFYLPYHSFNLNVILISFSNFQERGVAATLLKKKKKGECLLGQRRPPRRTDAAPLQI
jgi:hypothetical protein